jgi:uncharacterized protein (AIM24 family)
MVHEIDYKIIGHDMQAVIITLDRGETVRAEAGAMLYMDDGIDLDTSTCGGLMAGLKRKIAGESFFITTFTCQSTRADVAFAAPYPGHIIPVDLGMTGPLLCQRDSYLCSANGIEGTVAIPKRWARRFGGEGNPAMTGRPVGPGFCSSTAAQVFEWDLQAVSRAGVIQAACAFGLSVDTTSDGSGIT